MQHAFSSQYMALKACGIVRPHANPIRYQLLLRAAIPPRRTAIIRTWQSRTVSEEVAISCCEPLMTHIR
jgi:hypothetical protein